MGRRKNNRNEAQETPPPPQSSLLCVRFFILVLLSGFAALSIFVVHSLATLSHQIEAEDSIIQSLQKTVDDQQLIINRFNNSVTNTDVLEKVNRLEKSLHTTEHDMQDSLDKTTANIQTLLDSTVETLDQTVVAAQAEIHHEVDLVKGDVEQYVRTTQDQFSMENSFMVYQIAGTFTLVACLISMWHMTGHVRRFKRPFVQRKVLAILWMSPIYSVTSWLSLVFPSYEGYLAIIKDFYEAYVIYQFLSFLISVLGRGDRDKVVDLLAHHADHLEPPIRFFGWCRGDFTYPSPKVLADAVLMQCQIFAMQFVFFKPLTTIGLFVCNNMGYYGGGTNASDYRSPQFWLNIVQNVSVFTAFSGLLKFYHAVQDDLAWCRPFPKFLCIKGIVFMTFWQGLVIGFLASRTTIAGGNSAEDEENDKDMWGKQAQNFLICLEMLLFSIAHFYCFPTEEWQEGYRPAVEKKMSMGDNMAFGDFLSDLKLIMGGKSEKKLKVPKKDKEGSKRDLVNAILDEERADGEHAIIQGHIRDDDISDHNADGDDDDDVVNTTFDPDVSYDTVNESFDVEHISSSIDSTVKESMMADDKDVREAATRIYGQMQSLRQIEEDDDDDDEEETSTSSPTAPFEPEVSSYGACEQDDANSRDGGNPSDGGGKEDDDEETGETTSLLRGDGNIDETTSLLERASNIDETTSLLGGASNVYNGDDASDVQLRPSIFTRDD